MPRKVMTYGDLPEHTRGVCPVLRGFCALKGLPHTSLGQGPRESAPRGSCPEGAQHSPRAERRHRPYAAPFQGQTNLPDHAQGVASGSALRATP